MLLDIVDSDGQLFVAGQNEYRQLGGLAAASVYEFEQVNLKGRKCHLVAGGCHHTLVCLSAKPIF